MQDQDEIAAIKQRYVERETRKAKDPERYSILNPFVWLTYQEKQRTYIRWIKRAGLVPVEDKRLLDVGCGKCGKLHMFLKLGFEGENMVGCDLREDALEIGRRILPPSVTLLAGDAAELDLEDESFDVVFQATTFSSILDDAVQERLAARMWALVKPGGGILWHDFTWNNPRNPHVRGVSVRRVRELFPEGSMWTWRTTLAPPLARCVTKISPNLYHVFRAFPFLRTHVLCWIQKPAEGRGKL